MNKETVVIEYSDYTVSENNGSIGGFIEISDELAQLFMKTDHYHKDNIITLIPKFVQQAGSELTVNKLFFVLKLK